jgi:hypothetical protein
VQPGDHAIETFGLDRSHEAFGLRVGIGRLKWGLHDLDARLFQEGSHGLAPLGVPVTDQDAMTHLNTLFRGGERAAHLAAARIPCRPDIPVVTT